MRLNLLEFRIGDEPQRVAKRTWLLLSGNCQIVEIAWKQPPPQIHAVVDLLREDFGSGFKRHGGVADRVGRRRNPGERGTRGERYFVDLIALTDVDGREAGIHFNGLGTQMASRLFAESEPFFEEVPARRGIDEQIHIGAVAMRPTGSQCSSSPKSHVMLAAQESAQNVAHRLEKFGGPGREIVSGHQAATLIRDAVGGEVRGLPVIFRTEQVVPKEFRSRPGMLRPPIPRPLYLAPQ